MSTKEIQQALKDLMTLILSGKDYDGSATERAAELKAELDKRMA